MMRSLAFHAVTYAVRSRGQLPGLGGFGTDLYRRATSLLARLAVGGMVAVVAAILLGAVATSGGFIQLVVTLLAAVALWLPAFFLVSRIADWRRQRRRRATLRRPLEQAVTGDRTFEPARLDAAWSGLAQVSGSRAPEVRRLEQQLAFVWRALPSQSLDPQVHELQLLIGKRIPELIDTQLTCLPLRRSDRGAAVDELLHLLADFTADSVERYDRLAGSGREQHQVLRRRIEGHLDRDGFKPLS